MNYCKPNIYTKSQENERNSKRSKSVSYIVTLAFELEEREKLHLELKKTTIKDSFLRALREVAPEMELFLENHGQYINFL